MNEENMEQKQMTKVEVVESCLGTMKAYLKRNPVDMPKVENHAKKVKQSSCF